LLAVDKEQPVQARNDRVVSRHEYDQLIVILQLYFPVSGTFEIYMVAIFVKNPS